MRGIRKFIQGGGGPGPKAGKQSGQRFFCCSFFSFIVLNLFNS